jgi:STE24 endopeptidase
MTISTIFIIIIGIIIGEYILWYFLDWLNSKNYSDTLPEELKGIYDEEKYKKSQNYEKENKSFSHISETFTLILTLLLIWFGAFWWLDTYLRQFTDNSIFLALGFFWMIAFVQTIIGIPFWYYATFVIEEKYGFNKSTKRIFFLDIIKSLLLSALIGWILLALIVWVYEKIGQNFWIYAWGILSFFSVFMMMFYSNIIVPLFNKQTPLEEGELKTAINNFGNKVGFKIDNIFVIDGSKRSTKANAYFTGFWPKKRIVLYDTLIKDMTIDEIVAVLAHEIGHYKRRHTIQMLVFSILQTWSILFIFSLALKIPEVSYALWAKEVSFHMWAFAFGILFTPISHIIGIFGNILSRRNEYQADEFAALNSNPNDLQNALKKLSVNNLSNLRPHPWYEFFYYSHPTVLKRLQFLETFKK